MENQEIQKNNIEAREIPSSNKEKDVSFAREEISLKIQNISNDINKRQESIVDTTKKVEYIRNELNLMGEVLIPSVEYGKDKILELENKKVELEKKLLILLESDVSNNYTDIIEKVKQSKINWVNSGELERRLKLKGLDDNDISSVKEWLINNVNGVKTFILPQTQYKELKDVISEMTGDKSIIEGAGFYSPGGNEDLPNEIKNSVFIKEKATPPLETPSYTIPGKTFIDEKVLSHELGHATQDGLLDAEQFSDTWHPKFKEGAPDKEYVGSIKETDTRVRSMFNILGSSFDPQKEVFGRKHLEILREKQKLGQLDGDTKDLLEHYNDTELVKIANRTPAI